jgi:hypothetical protein
MDIPITDCVIIRTSNGTYIGKKKMETVHSVVLEGVLELKDITAVHPMRTQEGMGFMPTAELGMVTPILKLLHDFQAEFFFSQIVFSLQVKDLHPDDIASIGGRVDQFNKGMFEARAAASRLDLSGKMPSGHRA